MSSVFDALDRAARRLESSGGWDRALLLAWTVGLRAGTCLLLAGLSGLRPLDLSLFFDGHIYQFIARTFPQPYAHAHALFPEFPKSPTYLTAWFPLYPAAIRGAYALLGDWRLAALAASWAASGLAVLSFYGLARGLTRRPLAAALIFSFLPPTWLLCGSLAFVEPLFAALFIAAVRYHVAGRAAAAAAAAGLAIVAQKTGVLILPVLVLGGWKGSWGRTLRASLPYAAALLPLAALQVYLLAAFGSASINFETHRRVYGGDYLALPFSSLVRGLLEPVSALPGLFWTRKLMTLGSVLFYSSWLWAWRRREPEEAPLLAWLGVVMLFAVCLSGPWGYYAFARLSVVAAAPALLLLARRVKAPAGRWWPALLLLAPFSMTYAALDALGHLELWTRIWPPEYFLLALRNLAGPAK